MTDNDTDPDELGAELRRLFADERLEVTPTPSAGARIVAGARRRRRRRTMVAATTATAVVIAFAAGGLALSRPGVPSSPSDVRAASPSTPDHVTYSAYAAPTSSALPPRPTPRGQEPTATVRPRPVETPSTSSSSSPPSSTRTPMASAEIMIMPVLGPDGYKDLKLGMPFPDAAETGLLAEAEAPPPAEGCVSYRLTEGSGAIHAVTISGTRGIVDFRASGARTVEGISVGSPVDALRKAYPNLTTDPDGYSTPAGSGRYVFTAAADTVTEVHLVATEKDC